MTAPVPPAAAGPRFVLHWAVDSNGKCDARDFFYRLPSEDQLRMLALFQRLATHGEIKNREQFKMLGEQAKGDAKRFWAFKRFQTRFIGEFRSARRFIIAIGLTKKKDNLDPSDIEKAGRILHEDSCWREAPDGAADRTASKRKKPK